VRPRLSYANVVATLALFLALGGGAYAAGLIPGTNLRNRSVPGAKIRRNALTGTEIREGKLGTVPRAELADVAQNAARLGGESPGRFERTGRLTYGNATEGVDARVLSWDALGLDVRTSPTAGSVLLRNTGPARLLYVIDDGAAATLAPGADATARASSLGFPSSTSGPAGFTVTVSAADGARTLLLSCLAGDGHARCVGLRSSAG